MKNFRILLWPTLLVVMVACFMPTDDYTGADVSEAGEIRFIHDVAVATIDGPIPSAAGAADGGAEEGFRFRDLLTARRSGNMIEVRSIALERKVIEQLAATGHPTKGTLVIRPAGTVLNHNADLTPGRPGDGYVWRLDTPNRPVRIDILLPEAAG